jgi:predicted DNA-binding transcriptional regulator AlpA
MVVEFPMKINEAKIRAEAKRRGLNMTAFAKEIGIGRALLYHYMRKATTFSVAEKLGAALNMDPKDLII